MELTEPANFQRDFEKVSNAITALKQEKCLTGMILEECEKSLAYLNDYTEGSYKFTFLIEGEAQTGKTTLLNCLMNDDIVTGFKGNYTIIVQYDANCLEPELFISQLQDIYNTQKEIFIVKPEKIKRTGIKGRVHIQSALKEFISQNLPENESETQEQKQKQKQDDQTVFIIKYKIDWLENMIQDEFILNRIQFLDINKSIATRAEYENIMIFQSIASSKDHSQIFVADGQKLFAAPVSQKFQELKTRKDRSLLVINRTDVLGTKEHLKKISKNKDALASKLNTEFEDLEDRIEDMEETENDRREIFYQAFMEGQTTEPEDIDPRDILFFTSALYNMNRILIDRYQLSSNDSEKEALNDLFTERNKAFSTFRTNKKKATQQQMHVLQYYINSGENDEYLKNSSISYIQKAISEISQAKFAKLRNDLPGKLEKLKKRITNPDYLSKTLSEGEVQELRDLMENQVKFIFQKRASRCLEKIFDFYQVIMQQRIQDLNVGVKKINPDNPDFFVIKNSQYKQLEAVFESFKTNWKNSEAKFMKDLEEIEYEYNQDIRSLKYSVESKKHISNYVKNNVELQNKKIKKVYNKVTEAIIEITNGIFVKICDFVAGSNLLRQISFFISQLFGKSHHQCVDFPCIIKCSTEKFYEACEEMKKGYEGYLGRQEEDLVQNFEEYLQNAPGFSIERAQQILKEYGLL